MISPAKLAVLQDERRFLREKRHVSCDMRQLRRQRSRELSSAMWLVFLVITVSGGSDQGCRGHAPQASRKQLSSDLHHTE